MFANLCLRVWLSRDIYIYSLAFIPSNPPIPREPCFSRETAIHQLSHKKLLLSKSWSSHPRDSRWATICHHGWLIENSIFICIPWVSKEAVTNIPWISIDESMIIPYYLHNSWWSQFFFLPAYRMPSRSPRIRTSAPWSMPSSSGGSTMVTSQPRRTWFWSGPRGWFWSKSEQKNWLHQKQILGDS